MINNRKEAKPTAIKVKQKNKETVAIPRHAYVSQKEDRYETPKHVFDKTVMLAKMYGLKDPELDVFAEVSTTKCAEYLTKEDNAFKTEWLLKSGKVPNSIWINDPHSLHRESLERLDNQYKLYGFGVIMIIPRNVGKTRHWFNYIEKHRFFGDPRFSSESKFIITFPYERSIRFVLDGKPTINVRTGYAEYSRNAYDIVLFIPRESLDKYIAHTPIFPVNN